jgi:AraC family transcriptional regulator
MKFSKNDIDGIIQANYAKQSFNVEKLAETLGVSGAYLREFICFEYGICPHKLIENVRLEKSISYLYKEKVYIVARKIGYSNTRSFRRAFKKKFGMCPGNFMGG